MALKLSRDTLDWVFSVYKDAHPAARHQQKWNHVDCPAGLDNKTRLYTKMTEDGKRILCHCFHCGGSGVVSTPKGLSYATRTSVPTEQETKQKIEKENRIWAARTTYNASIPLSSSMLDDDPGLESIWPFRYFTRVTGNERDILERMDARDWYGMRMTTDKCVMTPRGGQGFDMRSMDKRMWRYADPEHEGLSNVLIYNTDNSDIAVICEDAVSAMKIDLAGYAGVALCCSTLSPDDAFKLSMRFKSFVVWLDNDNPEVIKNAKAAYDRLKLYTDRVSLNSEDRDPKNYIVSGIGYDIELRLKEFDNNKD